uniref:Mpv17-like protein 2 n=1 Tax=Clastoptera arizonana TaxID=38151 RepID=A0A1B6DMH6_9HEMI
MIIFRKYFHNFAKYKLLGKYLFLTNTISSAALMGIGDACQQHFELSKKTKKSESYDWMRTLNMTAIGLPLGIAQHFFYKYMDLIIPHRTLLSVSKKIILDQLIASPVCIVIFFYGLGLLEKKNFVATQNELKGKFFSVYMVDWIVWPPTQYVNFAYLSPRYRVVYINFITMLYDIFLSYIKYKDNNLQDK